MSKHAVISTATVGCSARLGGTRLSVLTFVREVQGLIHSDIADLGGRLCHGDGALAMLVGAVAVAEHGALERVDNLSILVGLDGQLLDRVLKLIVCVLTNRIATRFLSKSYTALAGDSALHRHNV